jgi:uncharacterized membrane protein YfcA
VLALALLAILGLTIGTIGTLIGAGGGFLLMPVLALLYPGERPELLASMSLAVVAFNALSGTAGYARMGRIDYRAGLWFGAASVPGAIAGAMVTGMLARSAFDLILGTALVCAGVFLLAGGTRGAYILSADAHHPAPHTPISRGRLWLGVAISLGVGFLSSLLGIGGGIIHVPLLVQVLGFPVHVATATSHFVLAITALTGTIAHLASGVFHEGARRTVALAIGALVGAQLGARLSNRAPAALIMRGLGVALVAVGLRIVWQGL